MPLEAYSLCPGGTGKRIKFCCKDLLGELQHIERMLEGEQYHACVKHIEQIEQKNPDRACLMSIKCQLLRMLGNVDDLQATVDRFLAKYPGSTIALAEKAMVTAVEEDGAKGIVYLQQALESCGDEIQARVYEACGVLAQVMLSDGQILAARALLLLQSAIHRDDTSPLEAVMRLNGSVQIPLLVRDDPVLETCPEGMPWKAAFDEAMLAVGHGHWAKGAEKLAALTARAGDAPAVWKNLATLRSWLGDAKGAVEALNKYASISVPLEDAVEAKALGMLMSDDPLGDQVEVLSLEYEVSDPEQLQVALASLPRATSMPIDRRMAEEDGSPPPKAGFTLFDKPVLRAGQAEKGQVPKRVADSLLFGRETDRAARWLFPMVSSRRVAILEEIVKELPAGCVVPEPKREVVGHVSASRDTIQPGWQISREMDPDAMRGLLDELIRDTLIEQWPQLPLGVLDGKTPKEASAVPAMRTRLLAAVLVLQNWYDQTGGQFDFNKLRSHLGLPTLNPINPQQTNLEKLPLVRLARVEVDKASDEALTVAYRRVYAFRVAGALEKYAQAMVERPALNGRDEQLSAYRVLVQMARDSNKAMEYVDRARTTAEAAGQSSAPWDLIELSVRLERGEPNELIRLVQHLQEQHIREPGVAQTLANFLVSIGAIRPDGSPTGMPMEAMGGQGPAQQPGLITPDSTGAAPGKLWTPDGGSSGSSGGAKLWTPG